VFRPKGGKGTVFFGKKGKARPDKWSGIGKKRPERRRNPGFFIATIAVFWALSPQIGCPACVCIITSFILPAYHKKGCLWRAFVRTFVRTFVPFSNVG
jgi:hypothetical protein